MSGSNTIAFNTKKMNWTTEYSFSPYRFSYVGNQLVSFPQGTSNIGHLHDKNIKYNEFYGETYPSEIQVVTNENPSATKIYEAFSLESTISDWGAEFRTETGEPQEGSIASGSLVTKEGKHYKDIPKNSLNTDVTIKYVGETTIGNLYDAQESRSIKLEGRIASVPNQFLAFVIPSLSQMESATAAGLGYAGATADGQVLLSVEPEKRGIPVFYDITFETDPPSISSSLTPIGDFTPGFGDSYVNSGTPNDPQLIDSETLELADSALNAPLGLNPRFNPSTNSIDVSTFYDFNVFPEFLGLGSSLTPIEEQIEILFSLPVPIFTTAFNAALNGEDMRGEYMKVKISRTGNEYYELYAINVDQHTTKLDHSLGQNN
jgi:hypothetical protein